MDRYGTMAAFSVPSTEKPRQVMAGCGIVALVPMRLQPLALESLFVIHIPVANLSFARDARLAGRGIIARLNCMAVDILRLEDNGWDFSVGGGMFL